MKKKNKSKNKNKRKKDKSITKILPFAKITNKDGIILKDGKRLDILKITCKDLINLSDSEIMFDNLSFEKLYKTYAGDLKIVGINVATDTSIQQEYYRYKIETAKNEVFKNELVRKLNELIYIAENRTDREYYLFFYAENDDKFEDNLLIILRSLQRGKDPLVKEISKEKKIEVLNKMSNQNLNIFN